MTIVKKVKKVKKVMANYEDLFSFSAADALAETESKKTTFVGSTYKPSISDEKCVDFNYRALVRFLPFVHEGKIKTTIERWECFLKDINGENGIYVVSPKTVGRKCPMREMSFKLYSSNNAVDKANSKKINVYQQWYALVEVVSDKQHPELEGKIVIYQFGKKIYDKIIEAQKGSEYKDAINPFAAGNARLFEINMTKDTGAKMGTRPVAKYDACGFIEKSAPIHFGDGQTLENNPESQKAYLHWLENDAPKITDYYFKEWDAETTERVNANLATFVSGYSAPAPRTPEAAAREIVDSPVVNESPAESRVESVEVDDLPLGDDEAWAQAILG